MEAENFEATLHTLQHRRPFRSFTVELVNGGQVQVDHPEAMVLRGGVAVFISAGGVPSIFDHEGVSYVEYESLT